MKAHLERLKMVAKVSLAQYPQYDGYHDNWILAMGTRSLNYKGGTRLCKGRMVLASPDLLTFYDPDTNYHCSVNRGDLAPY